MRHAFLVAFFFCIFSPPAEAQDKAPAKPPAMLSADRVQLVEDDEQGVLRIVIDGNEVARLDADGLHVDNLIVPTGTLALPKEAIPDWNRREAGAVP